MQVFKNQFYLLSRRWLAYLTLIFLLSQSFNNQTVSKISTSPLYDEYSLRASIFGGGRLYFKGSGFDSTSYDNRVFIGNFPCLIDNYFTSAVTLACDIPEQYYGVIENLEVTVLVKGVVAEITGGDKTLDFSNNYSPQVSTVYPRNAFPGDPVSVYGLLRSDAYSTIESLRISDRNIEFSEEDVDTTSLSRWSHRTVTGSLPSDLEVGAHKMTMRGQWGTGSASFDYGVHSYPVGTQSQSYNVRIHPRIDEISPSGGYQNGQLLTIKGSGFGDTMNDLDIDVNGTSCSPVTVSNEEVTCKVARTETLSSDVVFEGGAGLMIQNFMDKNVYFDNLYNEYTDRGVDINKAHLEENSPNEVTISSILSIEDIPNGSNYVKRMFGIFTATTTGNYKFYSASDDHSRLYISSAPIDTSVPFDESTMMTKIIDMNWSPYRFYFYQDNNGISDNQALVAGEKYYLVYLHREGGGSDNFTLSVEVPNSDASKPNKLPRVQEIKINNTPVREITEIKVWKVNSGSFQVFFPRDVEQKQPDGSVKVVELLDHATSELSWDASGNDMMNALRGLGWHNTVERSMLDNNGNVTTDETKLKGYKYVITYTYYKVTTKTPFIVTSRLTPGARAEGKILVNPSAPIGGSFKLRYNGQETNTLHYNNWNMWMQYHLQELTDLKDGVQVFADNHPNDGYRWLVVMDGKNDQTFNFQVAENSLTGGTTGSPSISINGNFRPKSNNLFFEPMPADFLSTFHEKPQVRLAKNGIKAGCPKQNCDYDIVGDASTAKISSFSISGVTLTMNLAAGYESLPDIDLLNDTANYSVTYGKQPCSSVSKSDTVLTCTLPSYQDGSLNIEAGSHLPQVHIKDKGYLINEQAAENVLPVVSGASPSTGSTAGGTKLTITGKLFPSDVQNLSVDVGTQPCEIVSHSSTEIICVTSASAGGTENLKVTVNSQEWDDNPSSPLFAYDSDSTPTITSLSMSSASPIVKQDLEINGSGFGTDREKIKVQLIPADPSSDLYALDCFTFNTPITDSKVTCKLSGGKSGEYKVQVTVDGKGNSLVNPVNANNFAYKIVFTSVERGNGSVEGGHLITITGSGFSAVPKDNQVIIGDSSEHCIVQESTTTEIKCLTQKPAEVGTSPKKIFVFGRVVEEAVYEGSNNYTFSSSATPIVSGVSTVTPNKVRAGESVTLTGTNLNVRDGGEVSIKYADVAVTNITSTSSTSITFEMPETSLRQGAFSVNIGGRGNAQMATSNDAHILENEFAVTSVSPRTGSNGGEIITIEGNGFLSQDSTTVKFGSRICDVLSVTPTQIVCWLTHLGGNNNTKAVSVKNDFIAADGSSEKVEQTCAECDYTSLESNSPSITGIKNESLSDPSNVSFTIEVVNIDEDPITATPYLYSQHNDLVVYPGLKTSGTATLAGDGSTDINVSFTNVSAGSYTLMYHIPGTGFAQREDPVKNIVIGSSSLSSNLQSSFNGGGDLVIQGNGFMPDSFKDKYSVKVCDRNCEVKSSQFDQLVCEAPMFNNAQTQQEFNISQPEILKGMRVFTETTEDYDDRTNDGDFSSYHNGSEDCFIGYDFGEGMVAKLTRIRMFPRLGADEKDLYGALIQGTNNIDDDSSWVTIKDIGDTVVENWNVYEPEDGEDWTYRYVRIKNTKYCKISEFEMKGFILNNNMSVTLSGHPCDVVVKFDDGEVGTVTNGITYSQSKTSSITSISPRIITTAGGTEVTLTGINLDPTGSVSIDGIDCPINSGSSSATSLVCTTGPRPTFTEPELVVMAAGSKAITNGNNFLYADRWSDTATWGGESLPRTGDLVHVPKGQTLLVDTSTPVLASVVVEGKLVFADEEDMTFDTYFLMINDAALEIGTETNRYQHNLTITLHGEREGVTMPGFGNKNIMVQGGSIDIHGKVRNKTWSMLNQSVNPGDNTIVLNESVDWQVGEKIVIAPTSRDRDEVEEHTIAAISLSPSTSTITLEEPLQFKHFAGVITEGGKNTEIRAEVGLLTRNVVVQGDANSTKNMYGSHIMIRGEPGKVIGRFSYFETRQAGQAFQMGRYPIHFHMIGNIMGSYIEGCSVHHTFNRATTIHGVHYLHIKNNVYYRHLGHAIFVEDSIETNNVIEDNLVIHISKSTALLKSDLKPAGIWVTHPTNFIRRNHISGSSHFSFWFDLPENPTGPSATDTICPVGEKLGVFENNVGHSSSIGLRIYPKFKPRTNPCAPVFNESLEDLYSHNLSVEALFENNVVYMNGTGVFERDIGKIRQFDMRAYSNGLQFLTAEPFYCPDSNTIFDQCLGVGDSDISTFHQGGFWGAAITTSRKDGVLYRDSKFVNFSTNTFFRTCSGCEAELHRDIGGRRSTFEGMSFENVSPTTYITYRDAEKDKDIFYDKDGTLISQITGEASSGGWITPYMKHLDVPECKKVEPPLCEPACIICDKSVSILRLEIVILDNHEMIEGLPIKILNMDHLSGEFTNTLQAEEGFSEHSYRYVEKTEDFEGHTFNVVTGYDYNLHFGEGADWVQAEIRNNVYWLDSSKGVNLRFNITETRELYDVVRKEAVKTLPELETIPETDTYVLTELTKLSSPPTSSHKFGDYHYDALSKMLTVRIDGSNRGKVEMTGVICRDTCPDASQGAEIETRVRLWSVAADWGDNGAVPAAGEDAVILETWNMVVDVETEELNKVTVLGHLSFRNDHEDANLKAKVVEIGEFGKVYAGTEVEPFTKKAAITLTGTPNDETYQIAAGIPTFNKALIVKGKLELFGNRPKPVWTNLAESAAVGATEIKVVVGSNGINWTAGDKIVIASSSNKFEEVDYATITAVTADGTITLESPLQYFHYGASSGKVTHDSKTIDMRAEVGILSRNIIIQGTEEESYGCSVIVPNYTPVGLATDDPIQGQVNIQSVQFHHCGQPDTEKAAVFLRSLNSELNQQSISYSSFTDSFGWSLNIFNSSGVTVFQNVISNSRKYGIFMQGAESVVVDQNLIVGVRKRDIPVNEEFYDLTIGLYYNDTASLKSKNAKISNNRVSSVEWFSYVVPGYACSDHSDGSTPFFSDNVAHSSKAGWWSWELSGNPACTQFSNFQAYKNTDEGFFTRHNMAEVIVNDMILADNGNSIAVNAGEQKDNWVARPKVTTKNLTIYGKSLPECSECYQGEGNCAHNGMYTSLFNQDKYDAYFELTRMPLHNSTSSEYNLLGRHYIENVRFENFQNTEGCAEKPKALRLNNFYQDGTTVVYVDGVSLESVDQENKFFFANHTRHLNTVAFCGKRDCTGIYNTPIFDRSGSFAENSGSFFGFNKGAAKDGDCTFYEEWNGHACRQTYGQLNFYQPPRGRDPVISPIKLEILDYSDQDNFDMANKFSHEIDSHNRFTALVKLGKEHKITYKATMPSGIPYKLYTPSENSSEYIIVKVHSESPATMYLEKGGNMVTSTPIVEKQPYSFEGKTTCGTNFYLKSEQTLVFLITGEESCELTVKSSNSIALNTRMDTTVADFYSNGGEVSFVQKVAALLGISTDRVRVVDVYTGSVVIDYEILAEKSIDDEQNNKEEDKQELAGLLQELDEKIKTGDADLGAPVLDFSGELKLDNSDEVDETDTGDTSPPETKKSNLGLALGLGLGIPIFLIICGIAGYCVWKKMKKGGKNDYVEPNSQSMTQGQNAKFNPQEVSYVPNNALPLKVEKKTITNISKKK